MVRRISLTYLVDMNVKVELCETCSW